jgi:hypothetical protein
VKPNLELIPTNLKPNLEPNLELIPTNLEPNLKPKPKPNLKPKRNLEREERKFPNLLEPCGFTEKNDSSAARARNAERALKKAALAHAKEPSSRLNPRTEPLFESSNPRAEERRLEVPPRLSDAVRWSVSGSDRSGNRASESPSFGPYPPSSAYPGADARASPNRRRPLRFMPPSSPEREAREARDAEATRVARWIETLGISVRRAGASGASSFSKSSSRSFSRDGGDAPRRDPFAEATKSPASELAAVCADGTLLCELVRVLEKKALRGVTWRPGSTASKLHNVGKALEALRNQPAMSPLHLWCEKDIVAADEETVVGLLGDMRACAAYRRAGRR